MSVTHIAGPTVTVGQRKIQRCLVCGEKLADNIDILKGIVASPDVPPEYLQWPPGDLVQQDGNRTSVIQHVDGTDLPEDCCINMVEE
jgi:hypothetical protein